MVFREDFRPDAREFFRPPDFDEPAEHFGTDAAALVAVGDEKGDFGFVFRGRFAQPAMERTNRAGGSARPGLPLSGPVLSLAERDLRSRSPALAGNGLAFFGLTRKTGWQKELGRAEQ